jgi:ATP-dependent exoDNAse (exonuclease V) beta subunit
VHKAKGLEWPRVLVAADFNRFIRREHGVVRRDLEEACVIYVALTRARNQLLIHPECVKELKASSEALNPEVGEGNVVASNGTAGTERKIASAPPPTPRKRRNSGPRRSEFRSSVR